MKGERLDIITTLPQTIIEDILCLLPIEEAARTSILSKDWRYKWTTIPKLEFFPSTVKVSIEAIARRHLDMKPKRIHAINNVLLLRQGPIHEFTLLMDVDDTYVEIDQIILHLSKNHPIKKFKLQFICSSYKLPLSLFSMHHLTELTLDFCNLVHQPTFNGFSSLTRLSLVDVKISIETLLHLLSNCPSLKTLCLFLLDEDFRDDKYPNIMELFKCLPVIEHLSTWCNICRLFVQDGVPEELSTSLVHLKYFCMNKMSFLDGYGLLFLCVLIKCSPNLEKIKIEVNECWDEMKPRILEKYTEVWLEHLNELEIEDFMYSKLEMDFVKFIMARSPNLKKVILRLFEVDKNEELEMLSTLFRAPHASPVEIIAENRGCWV